MGLLDFLTNPNWRIISKLPIDKQKELSIILATFELSLNCVAKDLVGPSLEAFALLIKRGEFSKNPSQAKSTGITHAVKWMLINEAMQALIGCEMSSTQHLPCLHYLEPRQVFESIGDLASAITGGELSDKSCMI
jgi:hypothetical protein